VGLLIALRYLISPLSLWAGHLSDTHPLLGYRRTTYIWLGRSMMVLSLPLLGFSLMRLGEDTSDWFGWLLALASSLMYGMGTLASGSPYLALVRDSAPREKQGLAISTVETVLIIFFAISGITFSFWMEVYTERIFWEMVVATMGIGGFFWFFSIWGAERRITRQETDGVKVVTPSLPFRQVINKIWGDRRTRYFFYFLALATMSAWAKDAILEPFGGELLDLPISRTTRFNSYWQAATVITLVGSGFLWRKRPPEKQSIIARSGLGVMAAGMLLLGGTAVMGEPRLVEVSLLVFGAGFGVFTFGGLSLMAVMTSDKEAGAYLGLWSISVLLFKGLGTFLGGLLRDVLVLGLGAPLAIGYGAIFVLQAMGLLGGLWILSQIDVVGFARDVGRGISRVEAQIAMSD
jgi:MFS transporter, BCD family, chlorophyll transporter